MSAATPESSTYFVPIKPPFSAPEPKTAMTSPDSSWPILAKDSIAMTMAAIAPFMSAAPTP